MKQAPVLIADIGGTNARFALAENTDQHFSEMKTLACEDFETFDLAIETYLKEQGIKQPSGICLAVAGPVVKQRVKFTNNPWQVDRTELQEHFALEHVRILNDFEAIAYSLPSLGQADLISVGGSTEYMADEKRTLGVMGPGTGLGVGNLAVREGERYPIRSEGGHLGFAPENQFQLELLKALQTKFQRVSTERLLSGPGIQNIYWALCQIKGFDPKELKAAEISKAAHDMSDAVCAEAMALFFEILGQAAGDLVMALGAFDGLYIAGGIVQRYPDALLGSKFRDGFERKGRYGEILKKVPAWLIMNKNPGLIGASYYANWGNWHI